MKRLIATISILVYFTVNTGFVINMHYCMDRLQSVQLGEGSDECGKCGMPVSDDGCCKDETKVYKLQQNLLISKTVSQQIILAAVISHGTDHLLSPFYNFIFEADLYSNKPPLISKQDTYLTNCVFRI